MYFYYPKHWTSSPNKEQMMIRDKNDCFCKKKISKVELKYLFFKRIEKKKKGNKKEKKIKTIFFHTCLYFFFLFLFHTIQTLI